MGRSLYSLSFGCCIIILLLMLLLFSKLSWFVHICMQVNHAAFCGHFTFFYLYLNSRQVHVAIEADMPLSPQTNTQAQYQVQRLFSYTWDSKMIVLCNCAEHCPLSEVCLIHIVLQEFGLFILRVTCDYTYRYFYFCMLLLLAGFKIKRPKLF
jgi:hypothetical protein